jgi:HAD superfamily hydrolase (TIGR01509 family)
MFDAVIFDWDGTLADTRKVVLTSFRKALEGIVNIEVADEFIESRIGIGAAGTFREILQAKGIIFDDALIKRLVEIKIQAEIERTNQVRLFTGAEELLKSLNGKVKMALASMNNREVINHMINKLKVKSFFSVVLTSDEVARSKPNPEIFLKSALKLETPPDKCAVVEDSIFGVKAAKAGNMGCIAVLTGYYTRQELETAKPDLIVNSLKKKSVILKYLLN